MKIAHRSDGPGRRVILVHGTRANAADFAAATDLLRDLDVIAYHRSGWAPSEMLAITPMSVREHADELLELTGGVPTVAVGHSWGGHVVLDAAIRRPDLIEGVALWETVLPWVPEWDPWFSEFMLKSARDVAARPAASDWQRCERERYRSEIEQIAKPPYELSELRVPCLLGHGTATSTIQSIRSGTSGLSTAIGAELFIGAGVGHDVHREAPAVFAAFVRRAVALTEGTADYVGGQ